MSQRDPHQRRSAWVLVRDYMALSGGELLAKVAGFVAFAWLARVLTPASYGHVELAIQLSMMASLLVDFGLGPVGARELAAHPERARSLAATIPTLRLLLAPIAYGGVWIATLLLELSSEAKWMIRVTALSLFAGPWVLNWLCQGLGKMLWVAGSQLMRMGLFALLVLILVQRTEQVRVVAVIEIVAASAMGVWFLVAQGKILGKPSLQISKRELSRLLIEAWPVGVSRTLWAVYQYAPILIVSQMAAASEVAWFAAAHRLVTSLGSFVALYHFNLYPQWVRGLQEGQEAVRQLATVSFRITSWVGVWIGLAGTVLSVQVCQLVFGDAYAASGSAFAVAIWTIPVALLAAHARFLLIAAGQSRSELGANAVGAIVTIASGIIAVRQFEALGAAIALLLGAMATWFVAHRQAKSRILLLPALRPMLLPVVLAAGVGIGFYFWLGHGWWQGMVTFLSYGCLAFGMDRKLLNDVQTIWRK